MIDKEEFYRGAALALLLEDSRCKAIERKGRGCYMSHDVFFQIRFTTKARSPWGLSLTQTDIDRFQKNISGLNTLLVFTCGGDGICVLTWAEIGQLLDNKPGWVSIRRKHNGQYDAKGTNGKLKYKLPKNRWPSIIFNSESIGNVESN